ncbi:hypothetical protein IMZ31_23630 (plasmid) [Pontibacillus sp. ALD_SL1]|uniref:hypothetical protein n=1 Tax=Pontibacillus sp. ALD_SL1 TaxID=2777185 RepID=UPI001A9677BA|nr:hypothetical protein [Pontibacillus sp. ALD_SL1]QST02443.1 hypothetical protein IMZ31_23630 [Pontibacillus sp. ALD_SL1]
MNQFIVSYIEDNELGVYKKEILMEYPTIYDCVEDCKTNYPTLLGVMQVQGLTKEQEYYYSHEAQDAIRASYKNMMFSFSEG